MSEEASKINPYETDYKVTISRYELMILCETVERLQKEMGWINSWIRNQAVKMGVTIPE